MVLGGRVGREIMTRWVCDKNYITADRESLQRVIVYPTEDNKEVVKAEHRGYDYKRFVLIKDRDSASYHCK